MYIWYCFTRLMGNIDSFVGIMTSLLIMVVTDHHLLINNLPGQWHFLDTDSSILFQGSVIPKTVLNGQSLRHYFYVFVHCMMSAAIQIQESKWRLIAMSICKVCLYEVWKCYNDKNTLIFHFEKMWRAITITRLFGGLLYPATNIGMLHGKRWLKYVF